MSRYCKYTLSCCSAVTCLCPFTDILLCTMDSNLSRSQWNPNTLLTTRFVSDHCYISCLFEQMLMFIQSINSLFVCRHKNIPTSTRRQLMTKRLPWKSWIQLGMYVNYDILEFRFVCFLTKEINVFKSR